MQKDFHLGITYVLCRITGFTSEEANIIAGSSQFVDDAVHDGVLKFSNKYIYEFQSSAHRQIDYRNFIDLKNHKAWIPFHFIPAAQVDGLYPEQTLEKLVCRPNSPVAQLLLKSFSPYFKNAMGMYHLGVTLHSYVDTWAHQGFSGFTSPLNRVKEIYNEHGELDFEKTLKVKKFYKLRRASRRYKTYNNSKITIFLNLIKILYQKILSFGISEFNPIGHGAVLSFPDLPYLKWKYKNWNNQIISRNNTEDFFEAVQKTLEFLVHLRNDNGLNTPEIKQEDLNKIKFMMENIKDEDENIRLEAWKNAILENNFSFGSDTWTYECNEISSWTQELFSIESELEFEKNDLNYPCSFVQSHWKLAHDAIILHRYLLVHTVLPQFDICVF